jgi:hypothetical protein
MRVSRLFKRLRRWSSHAFRKRHSPAAFRTCRNAGNSVLTAEGTTSKGIGSIICEVEFCIFYRLSLRTLRTNDVIHSLHHLWGLAAIYIFYLVFKTFVLKHLRIISFWSKYVAPKRIIKGRVWRTYACLNDYMHTTGWLTWKSCQSGIYSSYCDLPNNFFRSIMLMTYSLVVHCQKLNTNANFFLRSDIPVVYIRTTVDQWSKNSSQKHNYICIYNNLSTTCFGHFLTGHHQVGVQCKRIYCSNANYLDRRVFLVFLSFPSKCQDSYPKLPHDHPLPHPFKFSTH